MASTKTFVDIYEVIRMMSRACWTRGSHERVEAAAPHGWRAGHPEGDVGARRQHGAGGARGASPAGAGGGHGLHDGAEADANHDGQGPGGARRVPARARVPGPGDGAAHAAAVGDGPGGARLRRLSGAAGHAGVVLAQDEPGGAGPVAPVARFPGRSGRMSSLWMESLGWALVHSLWQGALVALGLAVALVTVGRRAANARYALACGALVLTVVLPAATGWRHATRARATRQAEHAAATRAVHEEPLLAPRAPLRWAGTPRAVVSSEREATTSGWTRLEPASVLTRLVEQARASLDSLLRWVVLAWVAGVGLSSGRLTAEWVQLRRLARRALPAPREWQERLDTLSRRLGLTRAVRLLQSTEVDVPSTVGWLSPVVLLPVSTLCGLPTRQLEMVLAHELAHIRRHDFAVNLAQVVVETLFFYHPAVRWMSNVIRVEREHCCDDVAVGASGNSVSYARALTALEALRVLPSESSHAMSALGGSLPERVRRLVSPPAPRCSSRW